MYCSGTTWWHSSTSEHFSGFILYCSLCTTELLYNGKLSLNLPQNCVIREINHLNIWLLRLQISLQFLTLSRPLKYDLPHFSWENHSFRARQCQKSSLLQHLDLSGLQPWGEAPKVRPQYPGSWASSPATTLQKHRWTKWLPSSQSAPTEDVTLSTSPSAHVYLICSQQPPVVGTPQTLHTVRQYFPSLTGSTIILVLAQIFPTANEACSCSLYLACGVQPIPDSWQQPSFTQG